MRPELLRALIQNLEDFASLLVEIQKEAITVGQDPEKARGWETQLREWLIPMRKLSGETTDPLFKAKACGWGHYFTNLSRIFEGGFAWSEHDGSVDESFDKIYDSATKLTSGIDVRSLPPEAAPPV
jgi:hypothetical protein